MCRHWPLVSCQDLAIVKYCFNFITLQYLLFKKGFGSQYTIVLCFTQLRFPATQAFTQVPQGCSLPSMIVHVSTAPESSVMDKHLTDTHWEQSQPQLSVLNTKWDSSKENTKPLSAESAIFVGYWRECCCRHSTTWPYQLNENVSPVRWNFYLVLQNDDFGQCPSRK